MKTDDRRFTNEMVNDNHVRNYMTGNNYEDMSKAGYSTYCFEGISDWHSATNDLGYSWYGFIPNVKYLRVHMRFSGEGTQTSTTAYVKELAIYDAIMHPQNPYAIKLGTDDGTVLPLDATNTDLGAYAVGNQWKCSSVSKDSNYSVRFNRVLLPEEANNTIFKEIGLFGNNDGHLTQNLTEPKLANATGLFARALFSTPWSKTSDQTATIYYDISVSDNS